MYGGSIFLNYINILHNCLHCQNSKHVILFCMYNDMAKKKQKFSPYRLLSLPLVSLHLQLQLVNQILQP